MNEVITVIMMLILQGGTFEPVDELYDSRDHCFDEGELKIEEREDVVGVICMQVKETPDPWVTL